MIKVDKILKIFSGNSPLFPLPNFVLFPLAGHRFKIFESRYVQMIEKIINKERLVTISLLKSGYEENYEHYIQAIEESGPREGDGEDEPFKIVDLDIYSEFIGSESEGEAGQFKITVDIAYHGQTGGDGGFPTEPDDVLGEDPDLN